MATDEKRKTMAMFDTVTGSNHGTEIELLTKDGDPSGVKVRILGPDSDEAIRADRAATLRNMKLHQKGASNRIDVQQDVIEKLVSVTTGWSGMPGDDGKDRPFSKDAAREVYANYPAIRRDVLREHEDTRNFTRG
ncbi:MAG: hypothetical protein M0Z43_09725 [Acidithiobacillus sp.]|nr:hypothetical protein [Acidithiobacillus sp.]